MKKLIIIVTTIIFSLMLFSCVSTGKRSQKEIKEEFNMSAIYFIQNDGPNLMKYLNDDNTLNLREKEITKRRYKNLVDLINQMENN